MRNVDNPPFSDREYWDKSVDAYISGGYARNNNERQLWEYFKYCLQTGNRYYFEHPLLPRIKELLGKNVITIPSEMVMYRARVDRDNELLKINNGHQAVFFHEEELCDPMLESFVSGYDDEYYDYLWEIQKQPWFLKYRQRLKNGFEGFGKTDSGAPPNAVASAGRCNPENVSLLYTAREIHTAVAEIRPYIGDTVSVAQIVPKHNLKCVNFYYEFDEFGRWCVDDAFFASISLDFSKVNRGDLKQYMATQFITMLIQKLGFDGLCFRSSLVNNGMNYVVFNSEKCEPIASKLFTISEVNYYLKAVSDEICF